MKPGERLLEQLGKKYDPSAMIAFRFGRYDVATKTDEEGNPVLSFVGKADERDIIKGDQLTRQLVKDTNGAILKDHRDDKRKV